MPTSFPSRVTSAAPAHCKVGGAVKIAVWSRYSQLAANLRLETTYARLAAPRLFRAPPGAVGVSGRGVVPSAPGQRRRPTPAARRRPPPEFDVRSSSLPLMPGIVVLDGADFYCPAERRPARPVIISPCAPCAA